MMKFLSKVKVKDEAAFEAEKAGKHFRVFSMSKKEIFLSREAFRSLALTEKKAPQRSFHQLCLRKEKGSVFVGTSKRVVGEKLLNQRNFSMQKVKRQPAAYWINFFFE